MRRVPLRFSLVVSLLGTVLVGGCNQTSFRRSTYAGIDAPLPGRVIAVSSAPIAVASVPKTMQVQRLIPPTPPATPRPQPRELADSRRIERTDSTLAPEIALAPEWRASSTPAVPEPKPSHADVSTAAYSHAVDFSYVSGVLEHGRQPKIWLLRYAPAEVEDRFGGSVTLILDEADARLLRAGQMVRIEGALLDPDAGGSRPGYRVEKIEPNTSP